MAKPRRKSKNTGEAPPLLSASTILILSGFLIGLTVGRMVGNDLSPFVLACGLAGFLAYLGLDVAATRRKEELEAEEKRMMESRLDKHVMSLSSIGFVLPERVEEKPIADSRKKAPSESLDFELSQL